MAFDFSCCHTLLHVLSLSHSLTHSILTEPQYPEEPEQELYDDVHELQQPPPPAQDEGDYAQEGDYEQEPVQQMYDEEEPDQPLYDDTESATAPAGGGGEDVSQSPIVCSC